MPFPMSRLMVVLGVSLMAATADAESAAKKGDKKAPAANVATDAATKDPPRLENAVRMMKSEAYDDAAVELGNIVETSKDGGWDAEYHLAKALYRLELHHSALSRFARILADGPKNPYYAAALEWCLFISRKVKNQDAVDAVIAHYSSGNFPTEYKDEFHFRLARFHFTRAWNIESGVVAGTVGETRIKETLTGGKSFEGDIFSGSAATADEEANDDTAVKKKSGGGLSIDDDIFGSGGDEKKKEEAPKKAGSDDADAKTKTEKGKSTKSRKGRAAKEKESKTSDAAAKEAPKEPPAKEAKKDERGTAAEFGRDPATLSAKEHLDLASRHVLGVEPSSKFGPRAKFLEGVILVRNERDNEALDAFKAVVRATKEDEPNEDPHLRELAFVQLARAHFGAKQPSFSIFYYDKIDRDSYTWLDALYESSWAEFRLGRYEKALGNLLTLHSPFFRDMYFPESHILKAVIYYENCRYREAKEILNGFLARYEPVHKELQEMTVAERAPSEYWEMLEQVRNRVGSDASAQKSEILKQVVAIALGDARLEQLDVAYREVDAELKMLSQKHASFSSSKTGEKVYALLTGAKLELAKSAGRAVKQKLERERNTIKELMEQAYRIDVETSRAEGERLEEQLRDIESRPKDVSSEFVDWTDDEKLVWPFEGEYWRDELGTYQLTLAHSCAPAAPLASPR